jgi:hypothetical protein
MEKHRCRDLLHLCLMFNYLCRQYFYLSIFTSDQVDTTAIIMTCFRKMLVSNLILNKRFLTEACQRILGHYGQNDVY